ncbi:MAG: pyruvate kinase, partial [Acidobacteria bacterium]|nr:pyruvate kinase [Acidobacteriota bacterium]
MAPRRDFRHTKILCTLGPSSSSPEGIEQLARAGMNIARLNMSHGSHASHLEVIRTVKDLNERLNHPIALLADLQGPAIRTGDRLGHLSLEVGQEFRVTVGPTEDPEERSIHVDYQDMVHQVKAGDRITVDNGLINLEVLETGEHDLRCRVLDG